MIHHINSKLLDRAVKVVVVGAGGTGSHVIKRLAVMHQCLIELNHPGGLDVLVIDPDRVSQSNVGRQNYFQSDVGQLKAIVSVNRTNLTLLTKWKAKTEYVTKQTSFDADLVIGCVDNRKGRKAILESLQRTPYGRPTYYMDFGNAENTGQVILGQVVHPSVKMEDRLPHAAELFPEIIDDSLDATDDAPSCSLAEALEKQSLYINDTVALVGCTMLWELIRFGSITHHGQFVNVKTGRVTPLRIDPKDWARFGYVVKKPRKPRTKKVVSKT